MSENSKSDRLRAMREEKFKRAPKPTAPKKKKAKKKPLFPAPLDPVDGLG